MRALDKAASLINDGEHPNDALIKSATEYKVPAGHVQLMVNAVNTGRTNAQRLTTEDPMEKAGDFPVADVEPILEALYPKSFKTKQAEYNETVISSEYSKIPKWFGKNQSMEKAAGAYNWKMTDKELVVEKEEENLVKKAFDTLQAQNHNIDACRMALAATRSKAIKLASKLKDYFCTPGSLAYDELLENSLIMFGKQAEAVIKPHYTKNITLSVKRDVPVNIDDEPYSLVKEGIDLAKAFKKEQDTLSEAYKLAGKTCETLRPFVQSPEQGHSVMGHLYSKNEKSAFIGQAIGTAAGTIGLSNLAREIAKKIPGTDLNESLERKDLQNLMDPSHEMEIRNIQSEAMLNDLLANDEIVRGFDPEEVVDSFNEISQLAPWATNKKVIMRDLMRKRLSGGPQALDQFVTGDALKTQDLLRDQSVVPDTTLQSLKDHGVIPGGPTNASKSVLI